MEKYEMRKNMYLLKKKKEKEKEIRRNMCINELI